MLKNPEMNLPDNADVAFRNFFLLERRFKKDPAFAKSYAAVVTEYITAGHAKPVDIASSITRITHHFTTTRITRHFNPAEGPTRPKAFIRVNEM